MKNVPPWIKHDTMASMNTKYGMATYMTGRYSLISNDHMYPACNEDHQI